MLDITTKESVLVSGHNDIVLCCSVLKIAPTRFVIATGAKDARIEVHVYDSTTNSVVEVAPLLGHTEALTSLQLFNYNRQENFVQLVSTSSDTTIKLWKIDLAASKHAEHDDEADEDEEVEGAECLFTTHQSHSKDVNATHISRNGAMLATGSQDKTVKLWRVQYRNSSSSSSARTATGLVLEGTLVGHRRGVWDVAFSSVEQVVASCSSDGSVRVWNLATHQCIESYDVSENSLLRCRFINNSLQLLATDSAGIVFLLRFKTKTVTQLFRQKAVENTLSPEAASAAATETTETDETAADDDEEDEFENKLWSLDVLHEDALLTDEGERALRVAVGGTGSVVDILEDCTREHKEKEQQAREQVLLQQEQFHRHARNGEYAEAVALGLALNLKMNVFRLLSQIAHSNKEDVLCNLSGADLRKLLAYTEEWNTNMRSVLLAQELLEIVLRHYPLQRLVDEVYDGNKQQLAQSLARLIPHTQSTFDHCNTLLVNARILSYF